MSSNPHFIESFRRCSFVVLPRFLAPEGRAELRRSADQALSWSRAQGTVSAHTTPRISLLTHASNSEQARIALTPVLAFASSARVCTLLAMTGANWARAPQLKDAHYYHEQTQHDWDGDWHRDSQFYRGGPEQERQLVETTSSIHVRIALEDDDRLEVVPGSHARWDSDEEMRIRRGPSRATSRMPNAVRVVLEAGDACVFHAWSIHRGTYRRAPIRRTLGYLYA